jgi:hypothetical protein
MNASSNEQLLIFREKNNNDLIMYSLPRLSALNERYHHNLRAHFKTETARIWSKINESLCDFVSVGVSKKRKRRSRDDTSPHLRVFPPNDTSFTLEQKEKIMKPIIQSVENGSQWCLVVNYETWTLHLTVRGAENEGSTSDESCDETSDSDDETENR